MTPPTARKLRPPKGKSWASGFSEYAIDGEPNRFRYVVSPGWTIAGGPFVSDDGKRRVLAVVGARRPTHPRGASDGSIQLFEELADRPLGDNSLRIHA